MGISMSICEMEAKSAICRPMKNNISKVMIGDISGFENVAEYDDMASIEKAKGVIDDWEAFAKRNRISDDADAIYMDKLKVQEDIDRLQKIVERTYTGWIDVSGFRGKELEDVVSRSAPENRITGWELVSFDEMNEICAKCELSFDKGRGCIGSFGPETSVLPEIAKKKGCNIVASVFDGAKTQKRYTPEDAANLKNEVEILKTALPEEGKVYVKRYEGTMERLEAVADICMKEKCGFKFF